MVHLHLHSMFSLRDSIIRPEELAERLREIGQDTVAVTDHGGSLGGVTLCQTLRAAGIRYIHGCEFYICSDTAVRDKDAKYFHLVALCKDEVGRRNLNTLISLSERPENRYVKPRIDFSLLDKYGSGLIILSACLAGEVSRAILDGDTDRARETALRYQARFGGDYYLELQAHNDPEQIAVNREILRLGRQLGIPCVVTTDAHYVREADRQYQSKYAFNGAYREDGEAYIDCFVQSEQEVRDRLSYLDAAEVDGLIENTHRIADRCRAELPLSPPIMPKVDTPPGFSSNRAWLETLCAEGFRRKLNIDLAARSPASPLCPQPGPEEIETYISRYEYELNALDKMGFIDYILLVYSYASVGKRRGIARGSGGGSLVNYLTDITDIDPIEHGLYFERFIDVSALPRLESGEITARELKIPDIDLDFSEESCGEVMRFLYNTYGEDRVASIGKFGTNKTKGTIRDLCKVFGIELDEADRIAKSFESWEIDEIDRMIFGELETVEGAREAMAYVAACPELFDYVRHLSGLPKSFGLHACGKVVATRELDYYLPSCYDANGIRYLQGDMHDVEDVGLVKIDVLGLRTLDAEYDTLEQSGEDRAFLSPKQDYSDPKVLDIFRNGDTVGIFQMASPGMKKTLKKMNIGGIEDISVANALFRPGSLQYIDNYCRRKAGEEKFEYLHPDLEPILRNTYGIIVFQEQLIEIGRMAGLHNPDLLRKATGKKNPKLLAQIKPELQEKLYARGWSEEQFSKLWSDMLEFARYSFNKCVAGDVGIMLADGSVMTAEELWRRGGTNLLSMFPDGSVRPNKVKGIYQSGVRDVWTVTTKSGAFLTCSANHRFPSVGGYRTVAELKFGDILFERAGKRVVLAPVYSIEYAGQQMTYDIEMADPAHTFISESGLVTSNSHSSAYAIIAYMTAKQKAYYPAEFYCGLCNSYIGDSAFVKDTAAEIVADMLRHNIRLAKPDFRADHRRCGVRDGRVLWGIPLIRDCNKALADALYTLRDTSDPHFWRAARALCIGGFASRVPILVKLGFFGEFGTARELLRVLELAELFKFGERKSLAREAVSGSDALREIVERHASWTGAKGAELKTYKLLDCPAILDELEEHVRTLNLGELDGKLLVSTQLEYLGALAMPTGAEEDRKKLLVGGVFPLRRKKDGKVFGYNVAYTSLGSGAGNCMTVFKSRFDRDPITEGDLILCKRWAKSGVYFHLLDYEKVW